MLGKLNGDWNANNDQLGRRITAVLAHPVTLPLSRHYGGSNIRRPAIEGWEADASFV